MGISTVTLFFILKLRSRSSKYGNYMHKCVVNKLLSPGAYGVLVMH